MWAGPWFEARGIDVVTIAGCAGLCRICARNDSRLSRNRHHSSGSTSLCLQPVAKRCKNKLSDSSDSGSRWRHDAGSGSVRTGASGGLHHCAGSLSGGISVLNGRQSGSELPEIAVFIDHGQSGEIIKRWTNKHLVPEHSTLSAHLRSPPSAKFLFHKIWAFERGTKTGTPSPRMMFLGTFDANL